VITQSPPLYWKEACAYLCQHDSVLATCVDDSYLSSHGNGFSTLVHAIVGQQVSVKAAQSISDRLRIVTPEDAMRWTAEDLRAAGLSRQKITYIVELARFWKTEQWRVWPTLDDACLTKELTALKGVGRWTAEMFLIFHCMRPDIFPEADLGLQKAITSLYRISTTEIPAVADRWRPYRTVATWYLWRSLDAIPVHY
jgi:DNA-3-methyladenine glycosylase II